MCLRARGARQEDDGTLALKASASGSGPEAVIYMENRTLSRTGEGRLKWASLKCYRMPGTACQVTKHASSHARS